jgi:hypothetical protein
MQAEAVYKKAHGSKRPATKKKATASVKRQKNK